MKPPHVRRRPKVDETALGEVLSFMQLLWAVAHGLEATSSKMRAELGVTGRQRLVLRLISRQGSGTPKQLASVLHVHPSSLTGALRRLERDGLIRRQRDPQDGRRAILTLTAKGRKLGQQSRGTVESSVRSVLRSVSADKVAAAGEVLRVFARELGVDAP